LASRATLRSVSRCGKSITTCSRQVLEGSADMPEPGGFLGRVQHTAGALNWPAKLPADGQEVVTIRVMSSVTVVPDPQSCCPVTWPASGRSRQREAEKLV
jgi:hypothetical protein